MCVWWFYIAKYNLFMCFILFVLFLSCRSKVTSHTDLYVCSRFVGTMLCMGWSPWDTIWSTLFFTLLSLFFTSGTFYTDLKIMYSMFCSRTQVDRFTLTKTHLYTFHGIWFGSATLLHMHCCMHNRIIFFITL